MPLPTPVMILLMDDEPSFPRALALVLRRNGDTVDTAEHGSQALASLQRQRSDLVLCDLRMPALDGRAFYGRLLRQHPHLRTRLMFLTGETFSPDLQAFVAHSGQPCLYQPCPAAAVRTAMQQRLALVSPSSLRACPAHHQRGSHTSVSSGVTKRSEAFLLHLL